MLKYVDKSLKKETKISVVIPTHNRSEELVLVLEALQRQSIPAARFEVIVVDDGSVDSTQEILNRFATEGRCSVRYFYQNKKGPAAARNVGVLQAKNLLILFINDDTIPAEDLLERHLDFHALYAAENIAVLGRAEWAQDIQVPFFAAHYLIPIFERLNGKEEVRAVNFITCNISIKREFLLRNGLFDEDFPYAAHEDRELGYRLGLKGLRIKYNSRALVYHHHQFIDIQNVLTHAQRLGESLAIWEAKLGGRRDVLYKFNLPNFARFGTVVKTCVEKFLFNSLTSRLWLVIFSKIPRNSQCGQFLFAHLLFQAEREGYRRRKKDITKSCE